MTNVLADAWQPTGRSRSTTCSAAHERIRPYLAPTPFRALSAAERVVWATASQVFVKHENHQPTNSFKIRNGLSFMTALTARRAPPWSRRCIDRQSRARESRTADSCSASRRRSAFRRATIPRRTPRCARLAQQSSRRARLRRSGGVMQRSRREQGRVRRALDERSADHRRRGHDDAGDSRAGADARRARDRDRWRLAGRRRDDRRARAGAALEVYGVQAAGASAIHDSWHAEQASHDAARRHVRRRRRDAHRRTI